MAAPRGVGRGARAGLLLTLLLTGPAIVPGRIAASDGGMVLATHVLSSAAVDLDGDGSKEIVAVVADPDGASTLRVAAWGVRGGTWVSLGEATVVHWNAEPGSSQAAHLGDETAALLVVRNGDERRVIVAVGRPYEDGTASGSCCLSFGTARLDGDVLEFEVMPEDVGSAESITVVDMDADARDELLLSMSRLGGNGQWRNVYTLLRQVGDGFAAEPVDMPDDEVAYFNVAADTDGMPGDELLFMTEDGESLLRVAASDAGLRLDRAATADLIDEGVRGWPAGAADGVLVLVSDRGIATARWPLGGQIETSAVSAGTYPTVFLTGSGPDARLVEVTGLAGDPSEELAIRVYDLDLELELSMDAPPEANALWNATQSVERRGSEILSIYPQLGPLPGGLADGRPAFMGLGQLLAIDPGGVPEVRTAAQIVGGELIGLVGPGSAWLAHAHGSYGLGASAWLGGFDSSPDGVAASSISVVPVDAVLGAADETDIDVTLDGAVLVDTPDGPSLFADDEGFRATVAGDPGTVVITTIGRKTNAEEIQGGRVTVPIAPGGRRDANRKDSVGLFVIGPGGIARTLMWDLTTLRELPEVTAVSSFDLFESHATLAGEVGVGTSVTVDGQPVELTADGGYRTEVEASLWPRDVVVVARDPIGQEVVRHVEVVGFVDIRALPWTAIMVALTMGVGLVLFVRTPSMRPAERLVPEGDGRLEELDGDGI